MKSIKYEANITNRHGEVVKCVECKTLAAARAKFAALSVAGAFPDTLTFSTFNVNGEMMVYGEFELPSFKNYGGELGFITKVVE